MRNFPTETLSLCSRSVVTQGIHVVVSIKWWLTLVECDVVSNYWIVINFNEHSHQIARPSNSRIKRRLKKRDFCLRCPIPYSFIILRTFAQILWRLDEEFTSIFQVFLVLDAPLESEELTFTCNTEVANTTDEALLIVSDPYCEVPQTDSGGNGKYNYIKEDRI